MGIEPGTKGKTHRVRTARLTDLADISVCLGFVLFIFKLNNLSIGQKNGKERNGNEGKRQHYFN